MTKYENFATWLHGFLEISKVEEINKEQTQMIKDHLALLFDKKNPIPLNKKDSDIEDLKKRAEDLVDRISEDTSYPKRLPSVPLPLPVYPGPLPRYPVPLPGYPGPGLPGYPGFNPYRITYRFSADTDAGLDKK